MKLNSPATILDFDPFQSRSAADPSHDLAALIRLNDKRAFRYGKVGGSNISKGKLQIAPAPIANHANIAATAAAAAGAVRVQLTPGATAGAASIYDEGYLAVNDVDGEGQVYKISHNPAITASTAFFLELTDPIATALTTNSECTLVHNAYNGVVEAAVATRRACGVPLVSLTAAYYGWLQTEGVAAVLAGSAVAVGNAVVPSGATAGSIIEQDVFVNATDATRLDAKEVVGRANIVAAVDTEYRPITLSID